MVDEYQGALFDSHEEAKDKYRNKQAELEHGRALAVARTTAWNEGRPFPEDGAKYYQATQSVRPTPMLPLSELQQFGDHWSWAWDWAHPKQYEIRFAAWQRSRENYASGRPYVLAYVAKSRALALGCRIGRKRRILRIYKRADSSEPILCYWCLWPTERSDRHVDHVIPLVRGGAHAAENLRISCRHCNVRD
jgi:hypothetical protein